MDEETLEAINELKGLLELQLQEIRNELERHKDSVDSDLRSINRKLDYDVASDCDLRSLSSRVDSLSNTIDRL